MGMGVRSIEEENMVEKIIQVCEDLEYLEEILEEKNDSLWQFLMRMDHKKLAVLFIASVGT